jgi:hypothetical protein
LKAEPAGQQSCGDWAGYVPPDAEYSAMVDVLPVRHKLHLAVAGNDVEIRDLDGHRSLRSSKPVARRATGSWKLSQAPERGKELPATLGLSRHELAAYSAALT